MQEESLMVRFMENGLIFLGIAFLIVGAWCYAPEVISVSTSPAQRSLPIYSVETDKKCVSITFDSAWGNEDLEEILDILQRNAVHATFFFTGDFIKRYPEEIKTIHEAGHDLGNHGENHKLMSRLNASEMVEEILAVHERIYALTGVEMDLFRPPSGDYNDLLVETAHSCNYFTIQWDVDSLDWKNYGAQEIIDRVTKHKNLGNGSIILLHNGTKYTVDALEPLIHALQNAGYEIVPVSELIYREEYYIDHTGRQFQK